MKKCFRNFVYALLLLFGLGNYASSQNNFDYDDYVYEEGDADTDDYNSFFDDDEYDIDYYESANVGDLVYNPVTYYVGRTLYILDMETGAYYPITNRFRSSIGYPDQFFFDNFWLGRSNISFNFNFGRNFYNPRYTYYESYRGRNRYRNFNNFNWGFGNGRYNGFSIFFNNSYGPYSPYRRNYNPYRPYRNGWWGWYGPGGWNARDNSRSNLANIGGFTPNRNIRLNTPSANQGRTRVSSDRRSPRSRDIVNARSNSPVELSVTNVQSRSESNNRVRQRSNRSADIVNSRRQNRVNEPSRGETSRMNRSDQARHQSRYAQATRNQTGTNSSRTRTTTRRSYERPERSTRSSSAKNDRRSSSQARKMTESRSSNQLKPNQRNKSMNNYKSGSQSSSRSAPQNRSNVNQSKYSPSRNTKTGTRKPKILFN